MSEGEQSAIPAELMRCRATIDNIDAALVHLLAERFKATQEGQDQGRRRRVPADPAGEEC